MKTRREVFNENEFKDDVAKLGGEALKQGKGGDPDRLCWLPKYEKIIWFWAEWKREIGGALQYNQVVRIKQLRDKGHTVFVFNNNDEARRVMRALLDAN